MGPVILSMEVDDDDSWDSYYRLRIGSQIKYLVISPGTFDRDTLSLPLQSLPKLPTGDWTMAKIFRDKATGDLRTVDSPSMYCLGSVLNGILSALTASSWRDPNSSQRRPLKSSHHVRSRHLMPHHPLL